VNYGYILAAGVTGVFSVIVALIQKTRKENKEDHNVVIDSIKNLHGDVRNVAKKLDGHIDWHLKDK
jgi:hypothetical protein